MNRDPISDFALHVPPLRCRPFYAIFRTRSPASGVRRSVRSRALGFCRAMTVAIWLGALVLDSSGQTKTKPSFWTGQLEVTVLRCVGECGSYEISDTGIANHDPKDLVSIYSYKVYQNETGKVRHQLMSANTGGINEQDRGAEIVNYAQGYTLAFDTGAAQALRVPLVYPGTTSNALESREILGFKCDGVRRKWVQQRNKYRDMREIWTASEIGFKDPLFQVLYGRDANDRLGIVEVRAIRSIKASPPLEPSLFELPPGMGVFDFSNP